MNATKEEMIVQYAVTDAAIEELRERYSEVATVENTADLKVLKADITVVRTLRTSVEQARKDLKKDALEYGRKVDGEAKRITAMLTKIEDPMRAEQARYEDAIEAEKAENARVEAERIAAIQVKIDELAALPVSLSDQSAAVISEAIDQLGKPDGYDYQELAGKRAVVQGEVIVTLTRMCEAAKKREAEAADMIKREAEMKAESDRLAAEKQKFEVKQEAEREAAKKREDEATAERERVAKAESDRLAAEREKLTEERTAAAKFEAAERDRLAEERRIFEAEQRAAEEKKQAEIEAAKTPGKIVTCPHCGKDFEVKNDG